MCLFSTASFLLGIQEIDSHVSELNQNEQLSLKYRAPKMSPRGLYNYFLETLLTIFNKFH
jgi:hypothetical protein